MIDGGGAAAVPGGRGKPAGGEQVGWRCQSAAARHIRQVNQTAPERLNDTGTLPLKTLSSF